MKRVLRAIPIMMLVLIACTKEEPIGDIEPSNFKALASTDGTKVLLIWASPAEPVDSYNIYFNDKFVASIPRTNNSYLHDPRGEVGIYKLVAVKGNQTSKPLTVSTIPVVYSDTAEIFELNLNIADSLKNATFGFDDSFRLVTYSIRNRTIRSLINFYCTDKKRGTIDTSQKYFAPIEYIVKDSGRTDTTLIPSTGWSTGNMITPIEPITNGIIPEPDTGFAAIDSERVYSVKIVKGGKYYYGILKVGPVYPEKAVIVETKFQKIPGLRIIGK